MNTKPFFRHLICVLLVGSALGLSGCATQGYQRASQTTSTIHDTHGLVAGTQDQIALALKSLDGLVAQQTGDLRPQFESFVWAVGHLRSSQQLIARYDKEL